MKKLSTLSHAFFIEIPLRSVYSLCSLHSLVMSLALFFSPSSHIYTYNITTYRTRYCISFSNGAQHTHLIALNAINYREIVTKNSFSFSSYIFVAFENTVTFCSFDFFTNLFFFSFQILNRVFSWFHYKYFHRQFLYVVFVCSFVIPSFYVQPFLVYIC